MEEIKSINQWTTEVEECQDCGKLTFCDHIEKEYCEWGQDVSNYDLSKPGILIIDDNEGICSFMVDDLEDLDEEGRLDLGEYNVFVFYGRMCAYELLGTLAKNKDLNIQKAIIDITYGGTVKTAKGNIKLNGVDVFEVLYELHPELKYLFYTGNQMSDNIKTIGNIMNKYTDITNKKITDNILFKTQFSMHDRREYILKNIF